MEPIEFRTFSGFRLMLFRHEIKQVVEGVLVNSKPGDEPGQIVVGNKPYCEIRTSWNEIHSVDEVYDSVVKKVFGE